MTTFKEVFDAIADGLKDLSSLEIVTYKGTINVKANNVDLKAFDSMFDNAKGNADFKVVALTKSKLDGDLMMFYDVSASNEEKEAHNKLWESALQKRAAVIKMFETAIVDAIKK
jgi:hypothetical protein